jgi:2-dehydropantoate 2-reductase
VTRVAVFGAGAVGSYLGSRFAAAGADVHLVARGAMLEALRTNGLTIVAPDGTTTNTAVQATDDAASIGPVDFVIFGVKSYDTEAAAPRLLPLLGPETAVLSFQNGIDNEEKVAAAVGDRRVVGAAIYILSAIQSPGVVRSGPGRLVVGELRPGPPSERVLRLVELAKAGGVAASAVEDVRVAKWEKYVLLVAFSAVTASTQLTVGDVRRSPAATAMLRSVMHEAWSVGRRLDRQHALVLAQADNEGTSLRHDLLNGRRMELDALQGTLSRLGRETGVPTPWTDAAYAVLEPWAIRNARGAAT